MLNNIGVVYMEQGMFDKAVQYFTRAYDVLRKRDPDQAADCLNNIGTVYQYKGDTANALASYRQCMEINRRLGDRKHVSVVLNNIGYMYLQGGNYKMALDHFYQSLQIDEELGDVRALSTSYGVIAICYYHLSMLHAAEKYANLMLGIARKHSIKTDIVDAYKYLDSIEEAKGNYKQAVAYLKLSRIYHDSISNEKNSEAQSQLEMMYQKERAEKERLLAGKENEMKQFRAKEKEKEISHYILLIGVVLLLFLLVVYVAFFLFRRTRT
jgi:tetratricopeptide (TPR) repeat protein